MENNETNKSMLREAKNQYHYEYAKRKLKRVSLDLSIEDYAELKSCAVACGEPVNTYIKNAIKLRIGK